MGRCFRCSAANIQNYSLTSSSCEIMEKFHFLRKISLIAQMITLMVLTQALFICNIQRRLCKLTSKNLSFQENRFFLHDNRILFSIILVFLLFGSFNCSFPEYLENYVHFVLSVSLLLPICAHNSPRYMFLVILHFR